MPPVNPTFYNPNDFVYDYVMDELYYYHGGEALSVCSLDIIIANAKNNQHIITISFKNKGKNVSIKIGEETTPNQLILSYAHKQEIQSMLRNVQSMQVRIIECTIKTHSSQPHCNVEEQGGGTGSTHYIKTTYKHDGHVVYKCTHGRKQHPSYYIKKKDQKTGGMVWKKITLKSKN